MTRLWSVQSESYWLECKARGKLVGSPHPPDQHPLFAQAYNWMIDQMYKRMPGFSGSYPIWAWPASHLFAFDSWWGVPGERFVKLTFEVPESRILYSDFMGWHQVLNRDAIIDDDREFSESEMIESWQRIFTPLGPFWSDGTLQACVDGVDVSEVTGVVSFTI